MFVRSLEAPDVGREPVRRLIGISTAAA